MILWSDGVVHRTSGQYNLRLVTQSFGFVSEIVRVHGYAVSAYESRTVLQEVPLRAGCLYHVVRVYAHAVTDQSKLVHERYVHVALAVLHCFGGFRHFHVRCAVRAVLQYAVVKRIHNVRNLGCRAGGYLLDLRERVHFVTRVDTFRRVAAVEVLIELQPRELLQYRHTILLGAARING